MNVPTMVMSTTSLESAYKEWGLCQSPIDLPTVERSTVGVPYGVMGEAMFAFEVTDMTCGHCVSAITTAIRVADKDADFQIDLATHRVQVVSTSADAAELAEAIKDAGYTPVQVEATASAPGETAASCCGGCR